MKIMIVSLLTSILLISSCSTPKKTKDTKEITIASRQADCVGVAPQKCLLVKIGDATEWTFFYSAIEGFNYEPDYEYVIEVRLDSVKTPAADASSIRYVFVKEVSKIHRQSENLPEIRK